MQFPEIVFQIKKFIAPPDAVYLVGGAVRDALLNKTGKDFDFICTSNPRAIARKFADENNGAFFMLDEERHTCRVIIEPKNPTRLIFDFAQMRGNSINEDLMERDFTINSMAIDLNDPEHIIDPTKGGKDLQQKRLMPVKPSAIVDDPVRAIRAIRYAANLELKIDSKTADLIRNGAAALGRVSKERKRDEIFKIFEGRNPVAAIHLMKRLSIFEKIPLLVRNDFDQGCRQAKVLDEMTALLCNISNSDKNSSLYRVSLLLRLGRFRDQLYSQYYLTNLTGRDRKSLILLSLIAEIGNNTAIDHLCDELTLTTDESLILHSIGNNLSLINSLCWDENKIDNRSIYRFFKKVSDTGIDLVLLILSGYASRVGSEFIQTDWLWLLEQCETLINAWYCQPEVVNPKPFLNGNDLMFHFDLAPGPLIGEIIEEMKEEQAAGTIITKEDALEWVDLRLLRRSL